MAEEKKVEPIFLYESETAHHPPSKGFYVMFAKRVLRAENPQDAQLEQFADTIGPYRIAAHAFVYSCSLATADAQEEGYFMHAPPADRYSSPDYTAYEGAITIVEPGEPTRLERSINTIFSIVHKERPTLGELILGDARSQEARIERIEGIIAGYDAQAERQRERYNDALRSAHVHGEEAGERGRRW